MAISKTDEVLKLLEQLEGKKQEAIQELLDIIKKAEQNLFKLGYDTKTAPKRKRQKKSAEPTVCPICKFATEPPHDIRKHGIRNPNKKPFTDAELAEKGLKRIS